MPTACQPDYGLAQPANAAGQYSGLPEPERTEYVVVPPMQASDLARAAVAGSEQVSAGSVHRCRNAHRVTRYCRCVASRPGAELYRALHSRLCALHYCLSEYLPGQPARGQDAPAVWPVFVVREVTALLQAIPNS